MFLIPEVASLQLLPGVKMHTLDQCRYGSKFKKATTFMGNIVIPALRCDHPPAWWKVPWSGVCYQAPHPRLVGRQCAVPAEQWRPWMLRDREPHGEYISRAAARYPAGLNAKLAELFAQSQVGAISVVPCGAPQVSLVKGGMPEAEAVVFTNPLRGTPSGGKKAMRRQEDLDCVGGMARTARCSAARQHSGRRAASGSAGQVP